MTPNAPVWLDAEALDDAPLTRDGRRFEGGVREVQEPPSRIRCWITIGIPAERPVQAKDPRHGVTERIRASLARRAA
jgi:hypothetical protein